MVDYPEEEIVLTPDGEMNVMTKEVPPFVEAEAEINDGVDNIHAMMKSSDRRIIQQNLDKWKKVVKPVAVGLTKLSEHDITRINVELKEASLNAAQKVISETDGELFTEDELECAGATLPIRGPETQATSTSLFSTAEDLNDYNRDQTETRSVKPPEERKVKSAEVGMDKVPENALLSDNTKAPNLSQPCKQKRDLNESGDLESVVSGDILGDISSDEDIPSYQVSDLSNTQDSSWEKTVRVQDTADKLLMFDSDEESSLRPDSDHDSDLDDMLYKGQDGEDDIQALRWAGKLDDTSSVNSEHESNDHCDKGTTEKNSDNSVKEEKVGTNNADGDLLYISDPGSPDPDELMPDKSDSEVDEEGLFDQTLIGPTLDDNEQGVVNIDAESAGNSASTIGKPNKDMNSISQGSLHKSSPNVQKTRKSRSAKWTQRKKSSSPKEKKPEKTPRNSSASCGVLSEDVTKSSISNDDRGATETDKDEIDTKFIKKECKTEPVEVQDSDKELYPLSQKSEVHGYTEEIETIFIISDDEEDDSVIHLTQKPILIELSDSEEEKSAATASESDARLTDEDLQSFFEADYDLENSPIKIKTERERNISGYSDIEKDKAETSELKEIPQDILERPSSENSVIEVAAETDIISSDKLLGSLKSDVDINKKSILQQDLELSDSPPLSSKESSRQSSLSRLDKIPPLDQQLAVSDDEDPCLGTDDVAEAPVNNDQPKNVLLPNEDMNEETLVDEEFEHEMDEEENDDDQSVSSGDDVGAMEAKFFAMFEEKSEKNKIEDKGEEEFTSLSPEVEVKENEIQTLRKNGEQSLLSASKKADVMTINSGPTTEQGLNKDVMNERQNTNESHVVETSSKAQKKHLASSDEIKQVPGTLQPARRVTTRSSAHKQPSLPSSRLTLKDVQKERKKRQGKPTSCVVVINKNETQIARARQAMIDRENVKGKASVLRYFFCWLGLLNQACRDINIFEYSNNS